MEILIRFEGICHRHDEGQERVLQSPEFTGEADWIESPELDDESLLNFLGNVGTSEDPLVGRLRQVVLAQDTGTLARL